MGKIIFNEVDGNLIGIPTSGKGFAFLDSTDNKWRLKKDDGSIIVLDDLSNTLDVLKKSTNYTAGNSDNNVVIEFNNTASLSLDENPPIGSYLRIVNTGTSTAVSIQASGLGVLLTANTENTSLLNQYDVAYAYKSSGTEWVLWGDLGSNEAPKQIAGLQCWLDASDDQYLSLSGSNIETWFDRSNFNRDSTQSTGTDQAERILSGLNSLNTARFTNSQWYELDTVLAPIFDNDMSLFVVAKQSVGSADDSIVMSTDGVDESTGLQYNSGTNKMRHFSKGANGINGGFNNQDWINHCLTRSGTSIIYYRDGVQEDTGSTGSQLSTNVYMGCTLPNVDELTGEIAEVIIYNRALNPTEVTTISNYLANKWGL
jgi:hypothetical protein